MKSTLAACTGGAATNTSRAMFKVFGGPSNLLVVLFGRFFGSKTICACLWVRLLFRSVCADPAQSTAELAPRVLRCRARMRQCAALMRRPTPPNMPARRLWFAHPLSTFPAAVSLRPSLLAKSIFKTAMLSHHIWPTSMLLSPVFTCVFLSNSHTFFLSFLKRGGCDLCAPGLGLQRCVPALSFSSSHCICLMHAMRDCVGVWMSGRGLIRCALIFQGRSH